MRRLSVLAAAFSVLLAGPALAVQPSEVLKDPALEKRARQLSSGLRCLVCQNESIDDSNAPLARDLRLLVRERLQAGESDQQVLDFLVARYGQYVLLKPPFQAQTLLLYTTPFLVLLLAGFVLLRRGKTQSVEGPAIIPSAAALTDEERARLSRLLGQSPKE
jgi:cytochrome c-type biogenesis protein CcmH